MWNLHPQLKFMRRFTGHVHSRYLIRSGFGATKDRFVLSGSEGMPLRPALLSTSKFLC